MITFQDVNAGDRLHLAGVEQELMVVEKDTHLVAVKAPTGRVVRLYPSEFNERAFERLEDPELKPKAKAAGKTK